MRSKISFACVLALALVCSAGFARYPKAPGSRVRRESDMGSERVIIKTNKNRLSRTGSRH